MNTEHTSPAPPAPGPNPEPSAPQGGGIPTLAAWTLPLAVGVLSLAAMVGGVEALLWLRYERDAILGGEMWRVLSAHLVHIGWPHLAVNLGGLVLIWLLFGRLMDGARWATLFALCAVGVTAGLLVLQPELRWYVGLSGVLHGLFVAGAIAGIFAGYRAEWFLLGFVALKVGWEQLHGPTPGTEAFVGGLVIVDAHLYGAVTGLVAGLALQLLRRSPAAGA